MISPTIHLKSSRATEQIYVKKKTVFFLQISIHTLFDLFFLILSVLLYSGSRTILNQTKKEKRKKIKSGVYACFTLYLVRMRAKEHIVV